MSPEDYIDVSETGRVTVRWAAIASAIAGTIALAWQLGVVATIQRAGGGIFGAIGDLATWVENTAIGGPFGFALNSGAEAWELNAQFIGSLGTFGVLFAVIEIIVVTAIAIELSSAAVGYLRGS